MGMHTNGGIDILVAASEFNRSLRCCQIGADIDNRLKPMLESGRDDLFAIRIKLRKIQMRMCIDHKGNI